MNVSPKRGKMVNGFDPANAGSLSRRSQDFIDRRDRLLVQPTGCFMKILSNSAMRVVYV